MRIRRKKELTLLDELDKQIIRELLSDGRQSNPQIAKKVRSSEGTIRNRIRKLTQMDIIKVSGIINLSKLGFGYTGIIMLDVAIERLSEAEEILAREPNVIFLTSTSGLSGLIAIVVFPDITEYGNFLDDKVSKLPGIMRVETKVCYKITKMPLINDPAII